MEKKIKYEIIQLKFVSYEYFTKRKGKTCFMNNIQIEQLRSGYSLVK